MNLGFTDEQMLNLVNNTIKTKTDFSIDDFTGGSVQITSTNNHQLLKYKVVLFFGYCKNRHTLSTQIDIDENLVSIWISALLFKAKSMQVSKNGMNYAELNSLMSSKEKERNKEKEIDKDRDKEIEIEIDSQRSRAKSQRSSHEDFDYPEWLDLIAWDNWIDYRKEIKKPLKPSTIKQQLKFLEANKYDHEEIINQSIQNGWTGLFEIKRHATQKRPKLPSEYIKEQMEKHSIIDTEVIYE